MLQKSFGFIYACALEVSFSSVSPVFVTVFEFTLLVQWLVNKYLKEVEGKELPLSWCVLLILGC